MSVRPGTRLDGRYRLSDRLAYGGMGEVWRATDEVLSRVVAVKILRPELAEDEAFVRRFRAEARTTSGLPHNGIAAVYDYGETRVGANGQSPAPVEEQDADPVAYLVMELVPGEAMSSALSRDGAMAPELVLDLVAQAGRALHAAHQRGVIHRDIKPANLMVTPDGRVKVTDFGIARPLDHEPLTATGQVMGTAHYLAPELAKGQDASPLSDVYALGVVAYECLAGHRPFEGDNQVAVALAHLNEQPPPLPVGVPQPVRAVVNAAMEKDPSRRMPSADAFAAALEALRQRPAGEDQLTPGTGVLPGSAAAVGLAAAGLFGGGQPSGWAPGREAATTGVSPNAAGTHLLTPVGTGSMPANPMGPPGGASGTPGPLLGADGYPGYDGYGGGSNPFRTPTAPRGLSLNQYGEEQGERRSLAVPLLALLALLVVIVIGIAAAVMFGSRPDPTVPSDISTSAPATVEPSQETPTATSSTRTTSRSRTATTSRTTTKSPTTTTTSPPPTTQPPTSPPPTTQPPTSPPPTTPGSVTLSPGG